MVVRSSVKYTYPYYSLSLLGILTLCMLDTFSSHCCRLQIFSKKELKHAFRNTIRVLNGLDPDHDRHTLEPDLAPKCSQRLSADDKVAASMESIEMPDNRGKIVRT